MKPFDTMPPHTRIWIYQCSRFLTENESEMVRHNCERFVEGWDAHGNDLSASFDLRYNLFLIFAVDEQAAGISGCSIDKSVALLKALESELDVEFLNRMTIAWKEEDQVHLTPMNEFWAMRKAGVVNDTTEVFNNLVKDKAEFDLNWETSFAKSWHNEMW